MNNRLALVGLMALAVVDHARAIGPLGFELEALQREIAVAEAQVDAFEALAARRVAAHLAWKDWWQKLQKVLGASQEDAKTVLATRQQELAKLVALVGSLQDGEPSKVWVEGHYWVGPKKAAELLVSQRKAKEAFEKLVREGKDKWWLLVARWVTSGEVQARIDALDEAARGVEESVKDGSMKVWFEGHRWQRLRDLRDKIQSLKATIEAREVAAQQGTYTVAVPGYGKTTRNELDEEIAKVEARIQDLQQAHTRGEYRLHRMVYPDTLDEKELDELLQEGEASYRTMEQLVGKGLYEVWFKEGGTQSKTSLEERLAKLDEEVAEVQKQVAAGSYKVSALGTEGSQKSLEEALEGLEKKLAQPDLKDQVRKGALARLKQLRRLLQAIPRISAFELFRLGLEKAVVTRHLAMVLKLAEPDFEKRKLTRELQTGWRDEFGHALEYDLAPSLAQLEYLQRIRKVYFSE